MVNNIDIILTALDTVAGLTRGRSLSKEDIERVYARLSILISTLDACNRGGK